MEVERTIEETEVNTYLRAQMSVHVLYGCVVKYIVCMNQYVHNICVQLEVHNNNKRHWN